MPVKSKPATKVADKQPPKYDKVEAFRLILEILERTPEWDRPHVVEAIAILYGLEVTR